MPTIQVAMSLYADPLGGSDTLPSASAPGSSPMIGLPGQVAGAAGDHSVLEAALEEARRNRAEKFELETAREWRQDVRPGEDPPFKRIMR